MIAGYPDEASVRSITKLRKELDLDDATEVFGKDYFHVTLRYWKSDDDDTIENIVAWLDENINAPAISCKATKMEILGEDNSLVIRLQSDVLERLHKRIDKNIQSIGAPASDFSEFKAHLTLAQGIEKAPALPRDLTINLNVWRLTNKDEETLWQAKSASPGR